MESRKKTCPVYLPPVLVGGQAVNVWPCRYEQDGRAWHELRPYTSRDLDYHGGLAEASPDGLQAFAQGIDLTQALPLEDMLAAAGFAAFFQQRWPQIFEKITRKRELHLQALREPQV